MTAYELMIKTNHHLLQGGTLTNAQKAGIARQLLAARSDERTKQSFYKGVRYPGNVDTNGRGGMYPAYFIPPYNGGKKLQTVIPMSPKTHILSANAYELEILRLLFLFAPDDPTVKDMVSGTLERLQATCFGNGCAAGECFHSALPVLRFLAAAAPGETAWINTLIAFFDGHIDEKLKAKKCGNSVLRYYRLCLSELPNGIAAPEIQKFEQHFEIKLI